jgi:hypothetical protein
MKKFTYIVCMIMVLSLMVMGTAFAAATGWKLDSIQCGTGTNSVVLSLSKNVYLNYDAHQGANGLGDMYTAGAFHNSGSRTHASSSMDSKLYFKDGVGTSGTIPASVDPSTASPDWSAWQAM